MTALTNTAIAAMKPGDQLKDDRVPGLSVRAHKHGKSFLLYYRTREGIVRRPKIGDAAVLSIATAREIARNELAKVAAGEDPKGAVDTARSDRTVADMAARAEKEHFYDLTKRWNKEAMRIYRREIEKPLGRIKVRALTYDDVQRVVSAHKATPFLANRITAVLSKMLSLAERWRWRDVGTNPCQLVERFAEPSRRRYASGDELARLGPILERYAADPEHVSGVAFLYLLMFSGARPSEIENGTPDMVQRIERDGQVVGVLRLDNGKTGRRDVFLPAQAMAVLDRLTPGRERLAGRKAMPRHLWRMVRKEAGCGDLWARDMRRTFATVGLSNGISLDQIGELLGHASRQTTMVYARLLEDSAHAATLKTANLVEQMLRSGRVVQDSGRPDAE